DERGIPPARIVLHGRSLGAAVAGWLATREHPAALILESAFLSVPELGAHHYPWLPVRLLARIRFPLHEYVKELQVPVLVVHSPDDEIVPFAQGRALYAAAPEPRAFLEIHGGHNEGFLLGGARYREGLRTFLEAHLARF
ncbi:MAG TPA: alpha/beta hydrolase, partial [Gammaproteobacteria bacterium]|nr:alpha/beta hydrolase [Gammaproteobacteria bacterium]